MTTLISTPHLLPPGRARRHWLLGDLPDFQRDMLGLYAEASRLGDVATVRFMWVDTFLISHPDLIKHILQDHNRNYVRNAFLIDTLKPVNGLNLFTADGDSWLSRRRLMQPAFHRQRIAAFGPVIVGSARAMLDRWGDRSTLAIEQEMMAVTLQVAGRALFSRDLLGESDQLGEAFSTISEYVNYRFRTPFAPPEWWPNQHNRALRAAMEVHDRVIYSLIRERRALREQPGDLLGMLIDARDADSGQGMTDDELRREISVMMFAGHETTAVTLTWALYLLSHNLEARQRLEDEVDTALEGRDPTIEDLPKLAFTRRVVDETLRLYPPAWGVARQSVAADTLGGFRLPAGSGLTLFTYGIHRDPRFWPDPERFDPDRFLPERSENRPAFAYLPFGGGPRLCIGNSLALTEATLILAMITQRFRLTLTPGHPVRPQPIFTLHTSHGLPMLPERRERIGAVASPA